MAVKDGDWTLIKWDAESGRSVWFYEDGSGKTHIRTDYPVDNILKQNDHMRNDIDQSNDNTGLGVLAASIPLNIFYASGMAEAQEQGDGKFIRKWINDSNNAAFKTYDGTI